MGYYELFESEDGAHYLRHEKEEPIRLSLLKERHSSPTQIDSVGWSRLKYLELEKDHLQIMLSSIISIRFVGNVKNYEMVGNWTSIITSRLDAINAQEIHDQSLRDANEKHKIQLDQTREHFNWSMRFTIAAIVVTFLIGAASVILGVTDTLSDEEWMVQQHKDNQAIIEHLQEVTTTINSKETTPPDLKKIEETLEQILVELRSKGKANGKN